MKKNTPLTLLVLTPPLLLVVLFNSCNKMDQFENKKINKPDVIDPVFPEEKDTVALYNMYVNKWISLTMKKYYLWNNKIPAKLNDSISPAVYFKSMLFDEGNIGGDRFSQIFDLSKDIDITTGSPSSGYDYVLLGMGLSQNIYGHINYVVKGSPAESAGLKRGDLFLCVNGTQLTRSNFTHLINQTSKTHTITKAILLANKSLATADNVTIGVDYFEDNPVFFDTVYTVNNKNIGYLIYNSFKPDNNDGTLNYDKHLNTIFGYFKSRGVKELILDLRYNGGGEVSSAVNLASMIVGRSKEDQVFVKRNYNEKLQEELLKEHGEEYFIERFKRDIKGVPINHLDVVKLYVLVSHRTSSTSELIINGLKPYIDMILIGKYATVGKNVGQMSIESPDSKIHWKLEPIVVYFNNSEGTTNYAGGFAPNIQQEEYDIQKPKPLGDPKELLVARALTVAGSNQQSKATQTQDDNDNMYKPIASSQVVLYPKKQNMYIAY